MKYRNLLQEKMYNFSVDSEMIYNIGFKRIVDKYNNNIDFKPTDFKPKAMYSDKFKSPDAKKAHEINPVFVIINDYELPSDAFYLFRENIGHQSSVIGIRIPVDFMNLVEHAGGDIKIIKNLVDMNVKYADSKSNKSLDDIITKKMILGNIEHEMAHWLDDSLHNRHYLNRKKRHRSEAEYAWDKREINSKVYEFRKFKELHPELYDKLTLEDFVEYMPSVAFIYDELSPSEWKRWKKLLLRRLSREGLVGANMKYSS